MTLSSWQRILNLHPDSHIKPSPKTIIHEMKSAYLTGGEMLSIFKSFCSEEIA